MWSGERNRGRWTRWWWQMRMFDGEKVFREMHDLVVIFHVEILCHLWSALTSISHNPTTLNLISSLMRGKPCLPHYHHAGWARSDGSSCHRITISISQVERKLGLEVVKQNLQSFQTLGESNQIFLIFVIMCA